MSDFGTLRSLLHDGARDHDAFTRIVGVFANTLEPDEAGRVWLPYALEHLAPWDDTARTLEVDGATAARRGTGPELALARRLVCAGDWSPEVLEATLRSPWLSSTRRLQFNKVVTGPVLEWIAGAPSLRGLEELAAVNIRHPDGLSALVASGLALERLELNACTVSDEEMHELADSPLMGTLRALSLTSCGVTDVGARALASRPAPNLRELGLSHNAIGSAGVRELAHAQGWPPMHTLHLALSGSGPDGLRAFAELGRLRGCVSLDMSRCGVGDAGVIALAEVAQDGGLDQLESLQLIDDGIGPAGARALASLALPSLRRLRLERNDLGDGIVDLIRAPGMPRAVYLDFDGNHGGAALDPERADWPPDRSAAHPVDELYMGECGLDGAALEALVASRRFGGVRDLTLHTNPFGARGARALHAAPHLNALRYLDVESCELYDDGLTALLSPGDPPWARDLVTLDLGMNGITDASADVFAGVGFTQLGSLVLDVNPIGRAWCEVIARSQSASTLYELDMNDCAVDDDALEFLAASPHLTHLERLMLRGCPVTDRGVRALFDGPIMEGLTTLHANNARISDDTMIALAENPRAASLTHLLVQLHRWSPDTWRRLATSRHLTALVDLTAPHSVDFRRVLDVEIRGGARLNPWARKALGR
jgi:hypothetical protein